MAFYPKYVRLCNAHDISPSKAALEIGLSKTAVSCWKKGKSEPTDATLEKLATYFNVPVSYFFEDKKRTDSISGIGKIEISDIISAIDNKEFTKDQLQEILFAAVEAMK